MRAHTPLIKARRAKSSEQIQTLSDSGDEVTILCFWPNTGAENGVARLSGRAKPTVLKLASSVVPGSPCSSKAKVAPQENEHSGHLLASTLAMWMLALKDFFGTPCDLTNTEPAELSACAENIFERS